MTFFCWTETPNSELYTYLEFLENVGFALQAPFPFAMQAFKICIFLLVQESFGVFHLSQILIVF
jgi:hypothetical protein